MIHNPPYTNELHFLQAVCLTFSFSLSELTFVDTQFNLKFLGSTIFVMALFIYFLTFVARK